MNHMNAASRLAMVLAVGAVVTALLLALAGARTAISPGAGQAAAARSATTQLAGPPCPGQLPWVCPDGPPWG